MIKVVQCGNVVVVNFNLDVGIDIPIDIAKYQQEMKIAIQ